MIDLKIYPACLKCDFAGYQVLNQSQTIYPIDSKEYTKTDNIIKCKHEHVCKFIDGQEPIEIGKA